MEVTVRINPKTAEGQKKSFLISYFYQKKFMTEEQLKNIILIGPNS
jgi:hypothetical protein